MLDVTISMFITLEFMFPMSYIADLFRRVILAGDCNAVLDPAIDHIG